MVNCFVVTISVGSNEIERQHCFAPVGKKLVWLTNKGVELPFDGQDPTKTIETEIFKQFHQATIKEISKEKDILYGEYYPSIARPTKGHGEQEVNIDAENETELAAKTWREHQVIHQDFEACFNVASPNPENLDAFGTSFEKLIYFSCVGIEALFNKICNDNKIGGRTRNMSTFVKLEPFLRIREYSYTLCDYAWLPEIKPFDGWDLNKPSQSLGWFEAYNSLKHDKHLNQHKASMRNALAAAAGYYALSHAVFGKDIYPGYMSDVFFFHPKKRPKWAVDELYIPSNYGVRWEKRMLII